MKKEIVTTAWTIDEHPNPEYVIEVHRGFHINGYNWWEDICDYIDSADYAISDKNNTDIVRGFGLNPTYIALDTSWYLSNILNRANVNQTLLCAMKNEIGEQNAKEIMPDPIQVDNRVVRAVMDGFMDVNIDISENYGVEVEADIPESYCISDLKNVKAEVEKLVSWSRQLAENFQDWALKQLVSEYEYLTSDAAIRETLLLNEYFFDEQGNIV